MQRTRTLTIQQSPVLARIVVPAISAALAVGAGAIHLAHNYLPMSAPASGSGAPQIDAGTATGGVSGLMSLIMPHLSQVMLLNFAAFVGLAVVLIAVARLRSRLRVVIDVLLAALSVATLYAWNAMGRANPAGTGTLALVVELALIVIALGDSVFVAASSNTSRQLVARSAYG